MAIGTQTNQAGIEGMGPEGLRVILPVSGMTCQSCVRRVEAALLSVPGVDEVQVGLRERSAVVALRSRDVTPESLWLAVEQAGYSAGEWVPIPHGPPAAADPDAPVPAAAGRFFRLLPPAAAGLVASSVFFGVYIGLVTLAQGFDHATDLLLEDWYLVLPIVVGFGTQVGLFVHMRRIQRGMSRSAKALTGAGTGTSGVAMVACCAHHVADILPVLGLSGAALFLAEYRQPMMLMGITANLIGIAVMVRMVRRASRCHA